jgi:hypothetical protein
MYREKVVRCQSRLRYCYRATVNYNRAKDSKTMFKDFNDKNNKGADKIMQELNDTDTETDKD